MKTLFKNARVVDPAQNLDEVCDLLIEDGKIAAIGAGIDAATGAGIDAATGAATGAAIGAATGADGDGGERATRVVNAAGMTLLPGFVDMHCHLRDPGYTYKEDIASGALAAAKGGFTSVCCMANTNPVNDCAAVTAYIIERSKAARGARVYPIGAVTKGLNGEELAEMGEMRAAGIVAVSDDGKPVRNPAMMRHAMEYASAFGLRVISHCEDMALVDGGCMHESATSTLLGIKGIPAAAEETMLAREVTLARELGLPVHIAHVSTRGGVELLRWARAQGIPVTSETAPHYLYGTCELVDGYAGDARVNPPLRGREDVQALIGALRDGTIDAIATDHAPHHIDDKRVEFQLAASGISGFETAFGLCYTALVAPGHMTVSALARRMCLTPARILGLNAGTLAVGAPADITMVDERAQWTVARAEFVSKGKNTPFDGARLTGRVERTYVAGECVYARTGGLE